MCGAKGKDVYAKSFGFGFDLTLKNSPKLVLRILPIEFAKFIIKLFSVGTFLNIINPYLYEDSRRLRRQIRQLRYEYQQRISRTNPNNNSARERREFHRRRRRDLNQFTRNIANNYNQTHELSQYYDMVFDMDD